MKPIVFPRKKSMQSSDEHNVKKISTIRKELCGRMVKEYSTSQGFFYSRIIQNLIEKKEGDKNLIKLNDIKLDDLKQHMQRYYESEGRDQQFPQLLQYYKYYSQDSICFLNRQFSFLAVYHEKKKAVIYEKLKKQLNISDSQNSMTTVIKAKPPQKFDNVLSSLEITKLDDESYFVAQMLKKLVTHYGPSSMKTVNKIDSEFNFKANNLLLYRHRKKWQDEKNLLGTSQQQQKNTLTNSNIILKKKCHRSPSNRRFGSCEIPKSAVVRMSTNQVEMSKKSSNLKDKKRSQVHRRRRSVQNLYHHDSNSVSTNIQNYKASTLKTQQQYKPVHQKANRILHTQNNFRSKIQSIRNKIKLEKENITRKQKAPKAQNGCFMKKMYKKV